MRARPTRIFQPPESAPTSPSICAGVEAEPGEHLARAGLEVVAAELLEARLRLAVALDERLHLVGARRVGERVLELVQQVRALGDRTGAVERRLDDALALHLADVLR